MTVQDIDIANSIWSKKIADLKGNTTGKKPIHVAGNILKIPKRLIKIHKEVFMTAKIFFANGILFLISLSSNITFTAVSNIKDRKDITTFKAFKEIYMCYLKYGFQITTLHVDGEFAPLQALIQDMPRGPRFNISSDRDHVPEIEKLIQV